LAVGARRDDYVRERTTHLTMRATPQEALAVHMAARADGSVSAYLRRLISEDAAKVARKEVA
jgi:hypothetical protein